MKQSEKVDSSIQSFNGLRFYFSLLIFLNHLVFLKKNGGGYYLFENFFHNGGFSVLFFFLLSGFCFALGYGDKFDSITKENWLQFQIKRLNKIYPLYLVTMVVAIVLKTGKDILSGGSVVKELAEGFVSILWGATMTQAWIFTPYWGIGNSAAWFISSIFFLYLITPFLLKTISGLNGTRSLIALAVVAYIVSSAIILSWQSAGWDETILYVTPWTRIPEFIIGICCGYIVKGYAANKQRVKNTVLEAVSVVLVVMVYSLVMVNGYNMTRTVDILATPILMFMIMVFAVSSGKISDILGNRVHRYLGSISMHIYLIHFVVINDGGSQVLLKLFGTGNVGMAITSILLFIITFMLAVSWKSIEADKTSKAERAKLT